MSGALTRVFPETYAEWRRRFRESAARAGFEIESFPIGRTGPDGNALTIDVGVRAGPASDSPALVISSGIHGVEGPAGAAVQADLLEREFAAAGRAPAPLRIVLLHAINPYGFAWGRRCNEDNVDLNRNLVPAGEEYRGCPPGYVALDPILNPSRPPGGRWSLQLALLPFVLRQGLPRLRESIATGQYEYPQGLFFGGTGPARTHEVLAAHLDRWLGQATRVAHIDVHTGLGRWGECRLLVDYPMTAAQSERMARWFGAGAFDALRSSGMAYAARGSFGPWCVSRHPGRDYVFVTAEFGTEGDLAVLAGLRVENHAHRFLPFDAPAAVKARARLAGLFCPASPDWRQRVFTRGRRVVEQAIAGLLGSSGEGR